MEVVAYSCIIVKAYFESPVILKADAYIEKTTGIPLLELTIPSAGLVTFLLLKGNLFGLSGRSDISRINIIF